MTVMFFQLQAATGHSQCTAGLEGLQVYVLVMPTRKHNYLAFGPVGIRLAYPNTCWSAGFASMFAQHALCTCKQSDMVSDLIASTKHRRCHAFAAEVLFLCLTLTVTTCINAGSSHPKAKAAPAQLPNVVIRASASNGWLSTDT